MRRSPAFPCHLCGGRDWSYDENLTRWVCSTCFTTGKPKPERPTFEGKFNFEVWYKSVFDDWESINRLLAEHESDIPNTPRDRVIWLARKNRIEEEYERATRLADVAAGLKLLMGTSGSGDVYISIPELGLEIRHRW